MGQVFPAFETSGTIAYNSGPNNITLSSSVITIGGQQYSSPSLTLTPTTIGFGGVDAALQANKLYYIFAVIQSGVIGLIGTTLSTGPTAFPANKLVGYFDTNASSVIVTAAATLTGRVGDWKSSHMSEAQFIALNGPGWILADQRSIVGSTLATQTGSTTAPEGRGTVLRGRSYGTGINVDGDLPTGTYQNDAFQGHGHRMKVFENAGGALVGAYYGNNNNVRDDFMNSVHYDVGFGGPRVTSLLTTF